MCSRGRKGAKAETGPVGIAGRLQQPGSVWGATAWIWELMCSRNDFKGKCYKARDGWEKNLEVGLSGVGQEQGTGPGASHLPWPPGSLLCWAALGQSLISKVSKRVCMWARCLALCCLDFVFLRPKHGLDFTAGREKCLVNQWCSAEGSRVRRDLLLILHFIALNVWWLFCLMTALPLRWFVRIKGNCSRSRHCYSAIWKC